MNLQVDPFQMKIHVVDESGGCCEEGIIEVSLSLSWVEGSDLVVIGVEERGSLDIPLSSGFESLSKNSSIVGGTIIEVISVSEREGDSWVNAILNELTDVVVVLKLVGIVLIGRKEIKFIDDLSRFLSYCWGYASIGI